MYNTDNVEEQVKIFTKTFTAALDKCAPFKHKTIRKPPARWITNEIRKKNRFKDCVIQRIQEFETQQ